MEKRDVEPEQAGVRLGVDELRALALERGQCRADVLDLERDMVHTRAARSEKPPDGRVAFERREELDPPAADEHGRRLDALLRHGRAVLELGAEEARVRLERVVEVGDGHAEMMDAAWVHATMVLGATPRTAVLRATRRRNRSSASRPRCRRAR